MLGISKTATRIQDVRIQNAINAGYASDDEASDFGEPHDSGRTRSSARQANKMQQQNSGNQQQQNAQSNRNNSESTGGDTDGKGRKRKKASQGSDGEDSDDGNEKSKLKTICEESVTSVIPQQQSIVQPAICSCPREVMTCIGILPSLSIAGRYVDSDDSDSSINEDLSHTVLPTVSRNRREPSGD